MPYCSLEEAWGTDFKDQNYFSKVNAPQQPPSSSNQNIIPSKLSQKGLDINSNQLPSDDLDKYFPSYSGGAPTVTHASSTKSKIVPYTVSFPDRAKRNYLFPVEGAVEKDDDEDSALDLLEDNDNDIRFIDKQRRLKSDYEKDYFSSEDYFLYKKYLKLAQKYKDRLKRKYKNFIEEDSENKHVLENFSNQMPTPNLSISSYSMKDIVVIIIIGIFLIFALDQFVNMGKNSK